jgi:hypothetical protein
MKKPVYHTPDQYFDRLPARIRQRINAQEAPRPWWAGLELPAWRTAPALVLTLLVLWVGGRWLLPDSPPPHTNPDTAYARITSDEVHEYFQTDSYMDVMEALMHHSTAIPGPPLPSSDIIEEELDLQDIEVLF